MAATRTNYQSELHRQLAVMQRSYIRPGLIPAASAKVGALVKELRFGRPHDLCALPIGMGRRYTMGGQGKYACLYTYVSYVDEPNKYGDIQLWDLESATLVKTVKNDGRMRAFSYPTLVTQDSRALILRDVSRPDNAIIARFARSAKEAEVVTVHKTILACTFFDARKEECGIDVIDFATSERFTSYLVPLGSPDAPLSLCDGILVTYLGDGNMLRIDHARKELQAWNYGTKGLAATTHLAMKELAEKDPSEITEARYKFLIDCCTPAPVTSILVQDDIVITSSRECIQVWNAKHKLLLKKIEVDLGGNDCNLVAFEAPLLITSIDIGGNQVVRIWNIMTGEALYNERGNVASYHSVAYFNGKLFSFHQPQHAPVHLRMQQAV